MDSLVVDQILKDIEVLFSRETVQEWASQYGIKAALIGALSYYLLRRVRRPLAFSTLKGEQGFTDLSAKSLGAHFRPALRKVFNRAFR